MTERRTGANPRTVEGVVFTCWHRAISSYEWRGGKAIVCRQVYNRETYNTFVNGRPILTGNGSAKPRRFNTLTNAMRAGVALEKESKNEG